MSRKKPAIVLVAGGTGGHVFPALSLAEALVAAGEIVIFITDRRGKRYMPPNPDFVVKVLPLDRKSPGLVGYAKLGVQLLCSLFISFLILWRPVHTVVGFSGFPTLAPLIAAIALGKKIVIHEQNTVLGRVNRLLHARVKKILISTHSFYPLKKINLQKVVYVGLPIRQDIAALRSVPYHEPHDEIRLLITGGSQGAQSFATVIPQMIQRLDPALQQRLVIHHQIRAEDQAHAKTLYQKTKIKSLTVTPFIASMSQALANAHLVIARSGASTIAELAASGRPAILIPYPYATDNHQMMNAMDLTRMGGSWVIPQAEFCAKTLQEVFTALVLDVKKLLFASERMRIGFEKNSIKSLASEVLSV